MGQGIQTYGAELDALTLQRILTHVFRTNLADEESTGARPTPVCIWGSHGIGKTIPDQGVCPAQRLEISLLRSCTVRGDGRSFMVCL